MPAAKLPAQRFSEGSEKSLGVYRRVAPPPSLKKTAKELWRQIVDNVPAEWFTPANMGTLERYCVHMLRARNISAKLDGMDLSEEEPPKHFWRYLDRERHQSEMVLRYLTAMKLTPLSQYDTKKLGPQDAHDAAEIDGHIYQNAQTQDPAE